MLSRTRSILLLALIASVACHGQPGAAFSGASILAPLPEKEAVHDELLRADLGRADLVTRLGIADGLSSSFADDIIYLRGGLPLLRGKPAARAVVAAESIGTGATVRWQPVRAEASKDRSSGYTYGYAIYGQPKAGTTSIRVDRYIAFWRKEAAGWRIAGYAETYGAPPAPLALPAGAAAGVMADVAMSRTRASVDAIRAADSDFSSDATRLGTGEAFGRYAADDAQIFSPLGEFVTGPDAITASFGPRIGKSSFVWHPVEGEMAKSGDLGFTVGNAVITVQRDDGAPVVRYSKYLTVWKRQRDGSWRYVVDGGSARPGLAEKR
jgi:ketosteroid isomerase-like protein